MIPLDEQLARSCGELCGATNTSDIIDASMAILAGERKDAIVTSDLSDLRRLDPAARSSLYRFRWGIARSKSLRRATLHPPLH